MTPLAVLEPVYIAGTTVSKATLHNEDEIKRLDLHYNDRVIVVKSGDIIPKILRSLPEYREKNPYRVEFPQECPVCDTALAKDNEGIINYCSNINCPAQIRKRIEHFVSRKAMDIEGLGEAQIGKLIEEKLIEKIEDIYHLDFQKLLSFDNFGEKSLFNLKQAIEKSKQQSWDRVIFALGIRFVGSKTAKILANNFPTLEKIQAASIEDLITVDEIGSKIAQSVYSFFHNSESLKTLKALKDSGVKCSLELNSAHQLDALKGVKFLLTGTLANYTRDEAQKMIEDKGGRVISSVSKNLDYLVVGDNPGSKLEKAKSFSSIKIIDESEFIHLLKKSR